MKVLTLNGGHFNIHTPQEVLSYRSWRISESQKQFKDDKPIIGEVERKIAAVVRVHGLVHYDHSLDNLSRLSFRIGHEYSFKNGLILFLGNSSIPKWLIKNKDEEGTRHYVQYSAEILSAFGWIVTPGKDDHYYYLDLAPLLSLTPEDAEIAANHSAGVLASKALIKINAGILKRKNTFSQTDLALPADLSDEDYEMFILRLIQLMPSWQVRLASYRTVKIFPL